MKFFTFIFFSLSVLISPHMCDKKSSDLEASQCSEAANWKIADFSSFSLGNSQFNEFSQNHLGAGKPCKGLLWVNVTSEDWFKDHLDTVHLDPYCPDVICRCEHCGSRGMENQAFSGYVRANIWNLINIFKTVFLTGFYFFFNFRLTPKRASATPPGTRTFR